MANSTGKAADTDQSVGAGRTIVEWRRVQRLREIRWTDVRWEVLVVLAGAAIVFGYYGYRDYYAHSLILHPEEHPGRWTDYLYHSLALFLPATAPERPGLPIPLDIARFLAPAVAGYAALSALTVVFRDRAQQIRIPFMTNHTVVCGLGYVSDVFINHIRADDARRPDGRIVMLARRFRRDPSRLSRSVVVIEIDPANPLIEKCRQRGVPVLIGDAQSERALHAAGVNHASHLLAVTDSDAVNTQIVAIAREMARGRRRRVLHCLARIENPELCALLRVRELTYELNPDTPCADTPNPDRSSSLHYFNPHETAARLWLQEFPFFIDGSPTRPHLLVSRLDELGQWLIKTAARIWEQTKSDSPLWITVVDEHGAERIEDLKSRHPELQRVCSFAAPVRATAAGLRRLSHRDTDDSVPPLSHAYVTARHDEVAVEDALNLRQYLDPRIPLVLALSRAHGVANLVKDANRAGLGIEVFFTLQKICTRELIEGGSLEPIAKALHQHWREMEAKTARRRPPAWDELDDSRRRSNFEQAADIKAKLQEMGCVVTPLSDWQAPYFAFSEDEVDALAHQEHERWNRDRAADGWTLGGDKDVERRITPYLIPFPQLERNYPEIASYDREFARALPAVLASVGLQIKRVETSTLVRTAATDLT